MAQGERSSAEEITETLQELVSSFGADSVAQIGITMGVFRAAHAVSDEQMQTLRRYTLMFLESKHPIAVARIVARLCSLDTACGRETRQEDIAKEIGVSKQAVCNMEADIAQKLNLPRRSSAQARRSHSLMNLRNPSFSNGSTVAA